MLSLQSFTSSFAFFSQNYMQFNCMSPNIPFIAQFPKNVSEQLWDRTQIRHQQIQNELISHPTVPQRSNFPGIAVAGASTQGRALGSSHGRCQKPWSGTKVAANSQKVRPATVSLKKGVRKTIWKGLRRKKKDSRINCLQDTSPVLLPDFCFGSCTSQGCLFRDRFYLNLTQCCV